MLAAVFANENGSGLTDILKTSIAIFWNVDVRFRFIEDCRPDYPVTLLCDVLGVALALRADDPLPIVTPSTTSGGSTRVSIRLSVGRAVVASSG
jgi:hypothetical protein